MNRARGILSILLLVSCLSFLGLDRPNPNAQAVINTDGLIAFWDFSHAQNDTWISHHDPEVAAQPYPLHLKRIGDPGTYSMHTWPYEDPNSSPMFDDGGPFGRAIRFNKGYIYGAVERKTFEGTPLDLHGERPFTLIAWVKFTGHRHMVTGIWDEGGWNKYGGRRQAALFAGLFGQQGVIAHISATGAASYPQSILNGAQYARCRAIDGQAFADNQWVAMAMTYDPEREEVTAYLNGVMTPLTTTDPVAQDVYQYASPQPANPFRFSYPIYSPRSFVLKYNGYSKEQDGVSEHRLHVDLPNRRLVYERDEPTPRSAQRFRLVVDVKRQGRSILANPIAIRGVHGQTAALPSDVEIMTHDEVWTRLDVQQDGGWKQVGTAISRTVPEGAPFTFGRALGLGSEEIDHGSQLYLDGVAVFNRVLDADELNALSFGTNQTH